MVLAVPAYGVSLKSISEKAGGKIGQLGKQAQEKLSQTQEALIGAKASATDRLKALGKAASENTNNIKKIFTQPRKPDFCPLRRNVAYAPTVDDQDVIKKDTEGMIPVIKKYAPVIYLCNEIFYPAAVEDLFTAPGTQLVYQPNHRQDPSSPKTVVIPDGQVAMEKIYNVGKKYSGTDFYFDIARCTEFGSDPQQFTDSQGNLTTPIYVTWSKKGDKYYIVYGFMYGFNGAYPLSMPMQGDHEFDLEHITLELNKDKQLERIFYAAHSSLEGVWLDANNNVISYEGTHPVVYSATTGHGSYPRGGTYVRIYGFGNDVTCKSKRWVPQLVLLYPDTDERFDPKTMGWAYHSGDYGKRGVGSFKRFFEGFKDIGKGERLDQVQFCPNPANPNNPIDVIKYQGCIESKRLKAKIPGQKD